ncbi:hypothetical protein LIER_08251 [Lithospermum erythrorhizon]|uniref:Uncharacterized protein n=1 Tax=Lithospermum erythrorhizon TaxID=34254 RepID=A0AAV3PD89_LITER
MKSTNPHTNANKIHSGGPKEAVPKPKASSQNERTATFGPPNRTNTNPRKVQSASIRQATSNEPSNPSPATKSQAQSAQAHKPQQNQTMRPSPIATKDQPKICANPQGFTRSLKS